ncbi:MAG: lipoate--protein ligase [Halanaerobiales bacterium]
MEDEPNEIFTIRVLDSVSHNPWYNLAFEEYLLGQVQPGEVILYLWQNQNTVVIGRNQNAWKECRCQLLEDEGGKLARRLSGGGAVFHDLGNLNFTFVMDKRLYNLERQLEVILNAVNNLGIEARFSGRNDLVVNDKKFSGNAFYFTDRAAYHHGTILIDSDFSKLLKYLQVSKEKIQSKGIESVRSRVINLKEINQGLNIAEIKKALKESFVEKYHSTHSDNMSDLGTKVVDTSQMNELCELYEKYSSWEWRFGNSPDFDITYNERFEWGGVELGLTLRRGIIEQAVFYSDAMESEVFGQLSREFAGLPFRLEDIIECINKKLTEIGQKSPIAGKYVVNQAENENINKNFNENLKVILSDLHRWLAARDW